MLKNYITRIKRLLGFMTLKLSFQNPVNPDGSYRVPRNYFEMIIEQINKLKPVKSIRGFGKNEFLFRRTADIGGHRRISDSQLHDICSLIQKNDSYYKAALSRCVTYIDNMYCTGIVWYQPDPVLDNEKMNDIIQAVSKIHFLYVCALRPKNQHFTVEAGCTHVKEDNVYIFTFNNDTIDKWGMRVPEKSAYILRMKNKREAVRALKPNSALLQKFIFFHSKFASEEYFKYRLEDDLLEVYRIPPKPKMTIITKEDR